MMMVKLPCRTFRNGRPQAKLRLSDIDQPLGETPSGTSSTGRRSVREVSAYSARPGLAREAGCWLYPARSIRYRLKMEFDRKPR